MGLRIKPKAGKRINLSLESMKNYLQKKLSILIYTHQISFIEFSMIAHSINKTVPS